MITSGNYTGSFWWEADKAELHERVVSTFRQIDTLQVASLGRYAYLLSLYEGKRVEALGGYLVDTNSADIYSQESKENIIRPAIDALVAKISTASPRIVTQTTGGDWKLQKKAQDRTLLCEGVISDQKGYKKGRQVFRDGCIWDIGVMKVYPDYKAERIVLERLVAHEVVVDPYDAMYGDPRSLYTVRLIPKTVLKQLYPKQAAAIDNSGWVRDYVRRSTPMSDEMAGVIEAWHLPSGYGAKDGRHVVVTSKATLIDEPHTRDTYPIVVWRWKTRQYGWRGFSAVEDIENYQKQVDFLDEKIGKLMNNLGYRVAVANGSNINPDDLTNQVDELPILRYTGNPPVFMPDPDPPASLFQERERKKAAAFEQLGMSMLMAQSKKPSGLDSGVAQREFKDTQSERYMDIGQAWDEFWVEVGEQIMLSLEDLASKVKGCRVRVPVGGKLSEIKLSEIDWQENRYRIATKPSGLLPREPAGRLEMIKEISQLFPDSLAMLSKHMNDYDVDDALSLVSAPVSAIQADIDEMLDGKPGVLPEPFLDLQLAKNMVLQSYQKIKSQNAPEEIQQYHRNYLQACHALIESQMQMAVMMAAANQGQVPGAPGAMGLPAPAGQPGLPEGGV